MNNQIEIIRKTREFLLTLVKDLNAEQLNKIPTDFNNNIIWHLGHVIAAQQGVCYRRAGLSLIVTEDFFIRYKPDSKPEKPASIDEIEGIKVLLFSSLDQLEADYNQQRFSNYPTWTTRYGVTITSVDEAIDFLFFHEGMHVGYVMALKKLV